MRAKSNEIGSLVSTFEADAEFNDPKMVVPKFPGYEEYQVILPRLTLVREDKCIPEYERLRRRKERQKYHWFRRALEEIKAWFLGM